MTESQKIAELLKPRYMVIDEDTSGDWNKGDVIEFQHNRLGDLHYTGDDNYDVKRGLSTSFFDKYPHLFRPMPWYEGRPVEMMPEYVKCNMGVCFKISEYDKYDWGIVISNRPIMYKDCTPATREEYEEYKSKTGSTMSNKQYIEYFGTNLTSAGHYFFIVTESGLSISDRRYGSTPFDPERLPVDETGKYDSYLIQGASSFHNVEGYSVLAYSGSVIDKRGGCKSVFFIQKEMTRNEFETLLKEYPVAQQIIKTLTHE